MSAVLSQKLERAGMEPEYVARFIRQLGEIKVGLASLSDPLRAEACRVLAAEIESQAPPTNLDRPPTAEEIAGWPTRRFTPEEIEEYGGDATAEELRALLAGPRIDGRSGILSLIEDSEKASRRE